MTRVRLLSVLLLTALLSACSNDIELFSDDPGLPVVYGLINGSEDQQLISISRTFRFSGDGNALLSAQNSDSVYFSAEALSVTARNPRSGTSTALTRVNLTEEGVVRAPGPFPLDVNLAYRFRLSALAPEPGDEIVLEGMLPQGVTFVARATILTPLNFRNVAGGIPPEAYSFTSRNDFTFNWGRASSGAEIKVFELGFNFAYTETGPGGSTQKLVYYTPAQSIDPNANTASVPLDGLLGFLGTRLRKDPGIARRFDYMQLVLTGGDDAYLAYRTLLRANSGITATQELPEFTNVEGGLGLIGSITQLKQGTTATLQPASFDSLRLSVATRELNFQ